MRLLESQAQGERRARGTVVSVALHAAIIASSVVATMQAAPTARFIPRERVLPPLYTARPATPEPSPSGAGSGSSTPSGAPSTGAPPLSVPDVTPVGIPDLGADVALPGRNLEPDFGAPGATGTTPGAGAMPGTPDAGGIWSAHMVEVPAAPDARNPLPAYPELLRTGGIAGRVVVEFIVDSTGRVRAGSLVVVEATHALFATSVRRTVPSLRFTPARVEGRRVAQRVRVPFEFEVKS